MKRLFLSFAMLLALAGCSSDGGTTEGGTTEGGGGNEEPVIPAEDVVYSATIESAKQLGFAFDENSAVAVFRTTRSEKFSYDAVTEEFTKSDSSEKPGNVATPALYAIYPYHSKTGYGVNKSGKVTFQTPSEQQYKADGIDFASNPMMAVADHEAIELEFKNLYGYVHIPIYAQLIEEGQALNIRSIKLSGARSEPIAGGVTFDTEGVENAAYEYNFDKSASTSIILNCGEAGVTVGSTPETATSFYFIVPPATFVNGVTLEITNDEGRVIKTACRREFTVERGKFTDLDVQGIIEDAMGELLLDVEFTATGEAVDNGKLNLTIEKMVDLNGNAPITHYVHPEFTLNNIARFQGAPTNRKLVSGGYYKVDINNKDFRSGIRDGFTMEIVAMSSALVGDHWSRLVSTDTWGIHRTGTGNWDGTTAMPLVASVNNPGNSVSAFGQQWTLTQPIQSQKYFHLMFVYDSAESTVTIYRDGVADLQKVVESSFDPGSVLSIGAYTYANGADAYQPWVGDIALVRIYDDVLTSDEITQRYSDINIPETDAFDTTRPTALVDLQINEDCTLTNNGSLGGAVNAKLITDANGETPSLKTIKLTTYDKPILVFNHEADVAENSYYEINASESSALFEKLNDGAYSIEAIVSAPETYRGWSVAAGTEAMSMIYQNHDNIMGYDVSSYDKNRNWRHYNSKYTAADGQYHHFVYTVDANSTESVATYINGAHDASSEFYIASLCEMMTMTIGCAPLSNEGVPHAYAWNGNIVTLRVYDETLSPKQVEMIYNEDDIKTTLTALNSGRDVNTKLPEPFIDVKFNGGSQPTATDVVSNVPVILTAFPGGGVSVVDGVAKFAPQANATNDGWSKGSFFKVDYSSLPAIKDAINDGYTVEVIQTRFRFKGWWVGLFGGDGFALKDFGSTAGLYTMWFTNKWGEWVKIGSDSKISKKDGVYYHTLFTRDRTANTYTLYTNGEKDYFCKYDEHYDSTFVLIGSVLDGSHATNGAYNHWNGNVALFRIYKEPINKAEASMLYEEAQAQLEALNAK